uniref:Uncharacterized protein n=1 Tax=Nelumbo nucifera TaxID=4432 RepID=A0A822YUM3_NELNU|nr:TPA_asm: hypothetical protein HUJ06_005096 [Nelumbo nucifera]
MTSIKMLLISHRPKPKCVRECQAYSYNNVVNDESSIHHSTSSSPATENKRVRRKALNAEVLRLRSIFQFSSL